MLEQCKSALTEHFLVASTFACMISFTSKASEVGNSTLGLDISHVVAAILSGMDGASFFSGLSFQECFHSRNLEEREHLPPGHGAIYLLFSIIKKVSPFEPNVCLWPPYKRFGFRKLAVPPESASLPARDLGEA